MEVYYNGVHVASVAKLVKWCTYSEQFSVTDESIDIWRTEWPTILLILEFLLRNFTVETPRNRYISLFNLIYVNI